MIDSKKYTKPHNWDKSKSLKSLTVKYARYCNRRAGKHFLIFDLLVNDGLSNEYIHLGPALKDDGTSLNNLIAQYVQLKRITDTDLFANTGVIVSFEELPNTCKMIIDSAKFWDHTKPPRSSKPKIPSHITVDYIRTHKPRTWDINTSLKTVALQEYQWEQPHTTRTFTGGLITINAGRPDMFTNILPTRLSAGEDIRDVLAKHLVNEGITTVVIYFNGLVHPEITTTYKLNALTQPELWAKCGSVPLNQWLN